MASRLRRYDEACLRAPPGSSRWDSPAWLAATLALRLAACRQRDDVALGYLLVTLFVASLGNLAVAVVHVHRGDAVLQLLLPAAGRHASPSPMRTTGSRWSRSSSSASSPAGCRRPPQARAQEALERRNELTRLFDLTRDILLTTEREGALAAIARHVARRFELDVVAICVPGQRGMDRPPRRHRDAVDRVGAIWIVRSRRPPARSSSTRARGPMAAIARSPRPPERSRVVPVRIGTRAIGAPGDGRPRARSRARATRSPASSPSRSSDRSSCEERRGAELARQRAELSSALLASLSHDLRTPLTAIRTAISNLDSPALPDDQRREQARVAAAELERLTRLFDEILDMARIDAGTVRPRRSWTTPAEVVEAAISHAAPALAGRDVRVDARDEDAVEIDPRLASSALVAPARERGPLRRRRPDRRARVDRRTKGCAWKCATTARDSSRTSSSGCSSRSIAASCFASRMPGTGMGLAITRGLVAADGGRVWAENLAAATAPAFTIAVPARTRADSRGGMTWPPAS